MQALPGPGIVAVITDFADQAVMLPLAAVTGLALWLAGWRRGALAWYLAVPATLAVVGLAKLGVFLFGAPGALPDLRSPSGHTAAAALVFGGLAALLGARRKRGLVALGLALAFAVLIGLTRLGLHVHTVDDVVVGAGIGVLGAMLLAALAGVRPEALRPRLPLGAALLVLVLFHGLRLPAEAWLHHVADALTPPGELIWP
ncbi:MAG: phosphatase PAP2 family protein [Rhodospirillales bacterium]|nr:phosphatase PAP2 family protein [Rhodospirillales bacterium]